MTGQNYPICYRPPKIAHVLIQQKIVPEFCKYLAEIPQFSQFMNKIIIRINNVNINFISAEFQICKPINYLFFYDFSYQCYIFCHTVFTFN